MSYEMISEVLSQSLLFSNILYIVDATEHDNIFLQTCKVDLHCSFKVCVWCCHHLMNVLDLKV